jgi:hypothetical protein
MALPWFRQVSFFFVLALREFAGPFICRILLQPHSPSMMDSDLCCRIHHPLAPPFGLRLNGRAEQQSRDE